MEKYKSDRIALGLPRMYLLRKGKGDMTDKIKSAISIIENEMPHCGEKLVYTEEERTEAYTLAIRSLQAWSEVLQELELVISGCDLMLEDTDNPFYEGKKMGYLKAIDIINQHLEIEGIGEEYEL